MAPWITPVYIISGVVMAVGAYFTIRYRPYCTLKSPEREIAMELHRKKLMNEAMNREETEQNNLYKYQTIIYKRGNLILFIGIPVHIFIFAGNSWYSLSLLYYISMISLLPVFLPSRNYFDTYCIGAMPSEYVLKSRKEYLLDHINLYQKNIKGEILSEKEIGLNKIERFQQKFFYIYRASLNFGVVLHLLLDVWFGINGSLTIN